MIELRNDALTFSAPEVHPRASFRVDFQRTLRIPDDGKAYPLPPGLGRFPVRHVDDHASRLPDAWSRRGGVMLPLYQSEALWMNLHGSWPFAVKIAAGKINAVTGESWSDGIHRDPQDYMVVPNQPWLDGFAVKRGEIRQFVAMPLGSGYSAEEQITGAAEHGGLQIVAYPMKPEVWERRFGARFTRALESVHDTRVHFASMVCMDADMGLAPGGRMRQEIHEDPFDFSDWDLRHASRCFVHLANSLTWRAITGESPPETPVSAEVYTRHGYPWFEHYGGDAKALEGAPALAELESVETRSERLKDDRVEPVPTVDPARVIEVGRTRRVREWTG